MSETVSTAPTGPIISYPPDLPITARREEIVTLLQKHQVLVVAGETGSGKTTQLPKMCLEAGLARHGRIGCTQPRRVAALSVSRRVAEELKVPWGREVGCKMRFNDDTSRETRIKFMTDGILLAEIQSDPLLRAYSTLIIDEAHERSLNIDFLLGYLQGLLRRRGDLKLVITSATIDTEAFSKAFGNAPVVEVSGRLWPVEIRYHAGAEEHAEETLSYVETAKQVVEDVLIESDDGDVLVFLPTERDIRDLRDELEGGLGAGIEVLGLYGRMSGSDQERIFTPGPRRRVIVATNIAETSITLPRIRYVIDAGLARISRYNPRTRTKRLPVEPVSQSSGRQRAGRAGRLREGVCVRLYSEEDFQARPLFTQPEIQRANLAEVILRMKAFRLGNIEDFPFLNPPSSASIRAGYALLHELGALTETEELTPLGGELARLPIDPTLGRMLLQARREGSLPEMLVIAAGLSIPDPRERPEENREAAAAAHRAFADPDSDFLALLNIWRVSPKEGKGSANALRRFGKANFLSPARLREWREIHRQLADAVPPEAGAERRLRETPARSPGGAPEEVNYPAVHRAILTGLLGQIAQREGRNAYKASGNRQVTVFPGSCLYERPEKKRRGAPAPSGEGDGKPEKSSQPAWVMAGEIVETSQLFARSVAGINPAWVLELGAHLCQYRYTEPHWSAKAARVLALEKVLVHGLEVSRGLADYGRINPEEATELFIRGALVAAEAKLPHRFFTENQRLREKIENALTRVRSRRAHDLDESLYLFYAERIHAVSSVHDLNKLVRERITREPQFLCATEEQLIGGGDEVTYDRTLFPDQVQIGPTVLPVSYAYSPGEEQDGVTVRVPLPVAETLSSGQIQWLVPGLREEQISVLLRSLPKAVRKPLMPLEPKIREIAQGFVPGTGDFLEALAGYLSRKYRVLVSGSDFPAGCLPAHLQTRVEVVDRKNQTVAASRDLGEIRARVESHDVRTEGWDRAVRQWEKTAVTTWSFGDLPEQVVVEEVGGVPLLAFPGLLREEGFAHVRLFRRAEEARAASPAAVRLLAETALAREIASVRKELAGLVRQLPSGGPAAAASKGAAAPPVRSFAAAFQKVGAPVPGSAVFPPPEIWQSAALEHLLRHVLVLEPAVFPLTEARFRAMLESARKALPGLTYQVGAWSKQVLTLRQQILAWPKPYPGMAEDLARLLPADFLARTPHGQRPHLHRYLRAVLVRAERAGLTPAKDVERARQLAPLVADWRKRVPPERQETYRWMLEEFRVSLFAQELGTAQPVSAQRLQGVAEGS